MSNWKLTILHICFGLTKICQLLLPLRAQVPCIMFKGVLYLCHICYIFQILVKAHSVTKWLFKLLSLIPFFSFFLFKFYSSSIYYKVVKNSVFPIKAIFTVQRHSENTGKEIWPSFACNIRHPMKIGFVNLLLSFKITHCHLFFRYCK